MVYYSKATGKYTLNAEDAVFLRSKNGDAAADTMKIFIKTAANHLLTLDVTPSATVADVKGMIAKKDSTAPAEYRLLYAGKQLEGNRTLSEYNITKEATLQLLLRLCGGHGNGSQTITQNPGNEARDRRLQARNATREQSLTDEARAFALHRAGAGGSGGGGSGSSSVSSSSR
jgi:hypothetical protein